MAVGAGVQTRTIVQGAGYGGLRVEILNPEPSESDLDEYIDRIRSQYGQSEVVDRPAADGDYVTIDINGTQDDEPVEGADWARSGLVGPPWRGDAEWGR